MQSFRTELENPVVERDILDLERKIRLFREGQIAEEKFRSLRLARGIYGQRQPGVQMIRIKLPFGRMTARQFLRICDIADEYASGVLHATTRQDIQVHYVSLERTPELWAKLEEEDVTLREACGNTVRNITASAKAGIDPAELFDVSPYAYAMFRYFLRNPVGQEMGRKFKIAFSSSEADSAFTFIHDLGFTPRIKTENGLEIRGFRVYIGGGLGAQPFMAQLAYEFLPEDQLIPFTEAVLRVFDRYGERNRRMKARLKFLLDELGLDALLQLVREEWPALKEKSVSIDTSGFEPQIPDHQIIPEHPVDVKAYADWLATNVFEQKQKGYFGVHVKVLLGNLKSGKARELAAVASRFAADDIRVTVNQGYLLRFVRPENLPALFNALHAIGLAEPGFDSTADITACPGTDTCNLGIASSTGLARELERVIKEEFPELIHNNELKIKISGCPNSCGQHGVASIGFHGSSFKKDGHVMPAMQVLLGGGLRPDGTGVIAEKVTKLPSKRVPNALRLLLTDYEQFALDGEYYTDYYRRQGEMYFYHLLKPLATVETITEEDLVDWGNEEQFEVVKAVGECAGVIIDLVATLIYEAQEKLDLAQEAFHERRFADAIYHAYHGLIYGAKALLLDKEVTVNTQESVLRAFDQHFVATGEWKVPGAGSFREFVLQLNRFEPTEDFASAYLDDALGVLQSFQSYRDSRLQKPQALGAQS